MDDPRLFATSIHEIGSWLTGKPYMWKGNHSISEASLILDHQALLQIINHNIRPTTDLTVLPGRNSYFIYAASKLTDINLTDVLYREIVTCINNI